MKAFHISAPFLDLREIITMQPERDANPSRSMKRLLKNCRERQYSKRSRFDNRFRAVCYSDA